MDKKTVITCSLYLVLLVVAVLIAPIMGSFVSVDQAQQVAHANLSPNAEITGRSVWFVGWQGCDSSDVAIFYVAPYVGTDGSTVNNAVICSGFPFKGMTVRFK